MRKILVVKQSNSVFFVTIIASPKTVVLPRDYYEIGQSTFDTKNRVLEVARHIAFAVDLNDNQKKPELRGLIATARADGIQITEHELTEFLDKALAKRDADESSYSWVYLALFRRFEEMNRCHTWHLKSGLRDGVAQIAPDSPSSWS